MFYHQSRNIIIPHRFHARFAGQIAGFWGNSDFSLPPIDKESWLLGVADHDRGYDEFDMVDLIGLKDKEGERLNQRRLFFEKSLERRNNDTIADNLILTHTKFMCDEFPEYQKKINEIIDSQNKENINYDAIWSITNLVDDISFDCSLGQDASGEISVESFIDKAILVHYNIESTNISIDPRPFFLERFELMLYGCENKNYPNEKNISGILYSFSKD